VEVKKIIRDYVFKEFLAGSDAPELHDKTPLFSLGIIDSIDMIKFIGFIEETFQIEFLPRELDLNVFGTIDAISSVITEKLTPEK